MGQAIAVRTDFTSGEVRRLAQRAKEAGQARRLLAIAAVLDGSSREEAARLIISPARDQTVDRLFPTVGGPVRHPRSTGYEISRDAAKDHSRMDSASEG